VPLAREPLLRLQQLGALRAVRVHVERAGRFRQLLEQRGDLLPRGGEHAIADGLDALPHRRAALVVAGVLLLTLLVVVRLHDDLRDDLLGDAIRVLEDLGVPRCLASAVDGRREEADPSDADATPQERREPVALGHHRVLERRTDGVAARGISREVAVLKQRSRQAEAVMTREEWSD